MNGNLNITMEVYDFLKQYRLKILELLVTPINEKNEVTLYNKTSNKPLGTVKLTKSDLPDNESIEDIFRTICEISNMDDYFYGDRIIEEAKSIERLMNLFGIKNFEISRQLYRDLYYNVDRKMPFNKAERLGDSIKVSYNDSYYLILQAEDFCDYNLSFDIYIDYVILFEAIVNSKQDNFINNIYYNLCLHNGAGLLEHIIYLFLYCGESYKDLKNLFNILSRNNKYYLTIENIVKKYLSTDECLLVSKEDLNDAGLLEVLMEHELGI